MLIPNKKIFGYYWINDIDKPKQAQFPFDLKFHQAKNQAIDFCQHHGIRFNLADWIICAVIET